MTSLKPSAEVPSALSARTAIRFCDLSAAAEKAGGTILKPAAKLQWGGYGGI